MVGLLADVSFDLVPTAGARLREAFAEAGLYLALKPARAEDYLLTLSRILEPLFRGTHDFGVDPILLRIGRLKQERPLDTMRMRFDPELMPVPRAMLGLHHGLLRLKAQIDLGPFWRGEGRPPTVLVG